MIANNIMMERGDIFYFDFPLQETNSHIQQGCRPALVISNNANNKFSPTITIIPLTSQKKKRLPVHALIAGFGLSKISTALCEQIMVIDKFLAVKKIGHIDNSSQTMKDIEKAIMVQMGLAA